MSEPIESLADFTKRISQEHSGDREVLYRGHSKVKFELRPSVYRTPRLKEAESRILRDLVLAHPTEFASDTTTLEILTRAQHYSLPTRLLDVTWSPLVALYFTVCENYTSNGHVILFHVKKNVIKFYDSDTVRCIANLAYLSLEDRAAIDAAIKKVNAVTTIERTDVESRSLERLLHFIRGEKSHFQDRIEIADLQKIVCVKTKLNSKRIIAQRGAFLLFGLVDALETSEDIRIEKVMIPSSAKATLRRDLEALGINESTMFPEIDKASMYIRKEYLPIQSGKARYHRLRRGTGLPRE